jgi:hypothetical protein
VTANLRAIETRYKGCRFRSRLEARWAVFFDGLGVDWRYEPQGFDLSGTYYLPDFWLPRQAAWFEVKGTLDGPEDYFAMHKAHALATRSNRMVYVSIGDIPYPDPSANRDIDTTVACFPHGGEDFPYWWCECPTCGFVGLEFDGRAARLPCACMAARKERAYRGCERVRALADGADPDTVEPCIKSHCACYELYADKGYNYDSPRLLAAYEAARSARFEHGEQG